MRNRHEGHVRERKAGSWEIRYSLGTDPLTGRRKTVTATVKGTKADAKRELRRRLHTKDQGLHVDPSRQSVSEFIEHWLTTWASHNVSAKTFERYSELLRRHVAGHIGNLPVQKLAAPDLVALYGKLVKEGRDDGEGLAARTVGHVHRVLHRALKHAVVWKIVQANAAASASPPRVEQTEIEILQPARLDHILKVLRQDPIYPIMVTALGTGARRGELLGLRWQDVDLDRGEVRIERSIEQTKKAIRIKAPKTRRGRRAISLPAFAVAEIRSHWKQVQEQRLALGLGKSAAGDPVFGTITGEVRRPDGLTKEWASAAKRAGVDVTFHGLRHTHVSQLIAAGLDVLIISRRIGHANAATTLNVYGHLFPDSDGRSAKMLDVAFSSIRTE